MTKDELKALGLTEEQVEKIHADYGKNYVPKSQFNEKNEVVKQLKEQQTQLTDELEKIRKENLDNAELVKQIETLKDANAKAEQEMAQRLNTIRIDNAIEQGLLKAKARNNKTVIPLLDMSKLLVSDDKVIGLDEQLETIKKEYTYLFEGDSNNIEGVKPNDSGNNDTQQNNVESDFMKALGL